MTDGEDVPPELKDSKRLKSRRVRAGGATLHPCQSRIRAARLDSHGGRTP